MKDNTGYGSDPKRLIMGLFENTREGKICYRLFTEAGIQVEEVGMPVSWTRAEAETLAERFGKLIAALNKLGRLHEELQTDDGRKALLTEQELSVWECFLRPYAPCPVELNKVCELYERAVGGDELTEEENEILEKHSEWEEAESLKRLPFLRYSPRDIILRARRYEFLVYNQAPTEAIVREAECFAAEMVIYHFYRKSPNDAVDKILSGRFGIPLAP